MNNARLLAEELQVDNVAQRRRAAKMLAMLEDLARPAAIELLSALNDSDEQVRQWSTEALEMLGAPAITDAPAIAILAETATQDDLQYHAITLIGRLGNAAADYNSCLLHCIDDQYKDVVRARAIWALSRIVTSEIKQKITQHLRLLKDDNNPIVKSAVERAFGVIAQRNI